MKAVAKTSLIKRILFVTGSMSLSQADYCNSNFDFTPNATTGGLELQEILNSLNYACGQGTITLVADRSDYITFYTAVTDERCISWDFRNTAFAYDRLGGSITVDTSVTCWNISPFIYYCCDYYWGYDYQGDPM